MSTSLNERNFLKPMSMIQNQHGFLKSLIPDSSAYNIPITFRLVGRLDVQALKKALNQITERYDLLRISSSTVDGKNELEILDHAEADLPVTDLRDASGQSREEEMDKHIRQIVREPFRDKLIRFALIRLGDDEHLFFIVAHHLIFDLHTSHLFCRELELFYRQFASGEQPKDIPDPIQYSEYIQWEQEFLASDRAEEMIGYWKKKLENNKKLSFPTDRHYQGIPSQDGDIVRFSIPEDITRTVHELTNQDRFHLFRLQLAVYFILLYRYTGQNELTVGVPYANRKTRNFKNMMGPLTNIIPITIHIEGNMTFMDIMDDIRETMLGAYQNQQLPFEYIVNRTDPVRDPSYNPIFQTGFTIWLTNTLDLPGIEAIPQYYHHGDSQLDFFITFWETENTIDGWLEYKSDLFDESTARRIINHYMVLLKNIPDMMEVPVSKIPIMDDNEYQKIIYGWNDTFRDYKDDRCIPDMIEEQAALSPDSVAVIFENQPMTYGELNERANRAAHALQALGVKPDTLVGISIERSFELIVGLCAILKAGGAYVPIDNNLPRNRIDFLVENTAIRLLLTTPQNADIFKDYNDLAVITLDGNSIGKTGDIPPETINRTDNPCRDLTPKNLAYVIYTSGSTGMPKGVMVPHEGIRNRLQWMHEEYKLTKNDRVLQKTSFSFDVSLWEFFWPLITGNTMILAKPGGHRNNNYLISLIIEQQVTVMHFVPSVLHSFLETPGCEKCTSLRDVVCSGEALTPSIQKLFYERFDRKTGLHNLYGPTEASVDVSYWKCDPDYPLDTVPIGKPIANTQLYVLDKKLDPLPIGVKGELFIGGIGLARGYLNRPDLTEERFIPDPFSKAPGARLYKTGDVARWLPDGVVDFLGRNDNQIQLYGLRIELEEVESKLTMHPDVNECIVKVSDEDDINKQLIGIIVPTERLKQISPIQIRDELREFLKDHLPQLMAPSVYVSVDTLPHTSSGKIDRKAMGKVKIQLPDMTTDSVPTTEIEKTLTGVWKHVLNIENVGLDDNFFDLGGSSILIPQIISETYAQTGHKIDIIDLFKYSTVRALAKYFGADHEKVASGQTSEEDDRAKKRQQSRQRRRGGLGSMVEDDHE